VRSPLLAAMGCNWRLKTSAADMISFATNTSLSMKPTETIRVTELDCFLGRQPIYDVKREIRAYELLYQSKRSSCHFLMFSESANCEDRPSWLPTPRRCIWFLQATPARGSIGRSESSEKGTSSRSIVPAW